MLRELFIGLVLRHAPGEERAAGLWAEIEKNYTRRRRYYHNLQHLQALCELLLPHQQLMQDPDTLLFSLFYHDFIYRVTRKDNEARSAAHAMIVLEKLEYPAEKRLACFEQIHATRTHAWSASPDTNLFTDADLGILGQPPEQYRQYCKQVRKEYAIYPDLLYRPGRKKVVEHFLSMERIYKTPVFFSRLEQQARENLQRELALLS